MKAKFATTFMTTLATTVTTVDCMVDGGWVSPRGFHS